MTRHYYISDDLDDLETVNQELLNQGLQSSQIHVLSESDADVQRHHVNPINSLSKSDVIHSGFIGAGIGVVVAAVAMLLVAVFISPTGLEAWLPYGFLAVMIFGFCTWEGGLRGIQTQNSEFRRFADLLRKDKHVLIVDTRRHDEEKVTKVVASHIRLSEATT